MATSTPPVDSETFAAELVDLPLAADRLRLVGTDHAARLQQARLGAATRHLALVQARRPDDTATIAQLEARVAVETQAQRSYGAAVRTAETEIPARTSGQFILHGRVLSNGDPAPKLVVAAIGADGKVCRSTCTDDSGYFRIDLPVTKEGAEPVFLQVSDPQLAVLYRGSEAITPTDGGVAYRLIQLSGDRHKPCPPPPEQATMPDLLDRPESSAVAILGKFGLKLGQRLTQRAPEKAGLVISQTPEAGAPITAETSVTLVIGAAESGDTVAVPDVVGLTLDEASVKLEEAGTTLGTVSRRPAKPAGTILAQDPAAGTRVAPRTAVALALAIEPPTDLVRVPDLTGRLLEEADKILGEAGLTRGRITFRDDRRAGQVTAQDPKPDTEVAKGSHVDLVLGREQSAERTKVPDLTDRTLTEAQRELEATKLQLGATEGPKNGRVAEQKPEAAASVPAGSTVSIVLTRRSAPQ